MIHSLLPIIFLVLLKGVIGCSFYTSWYDSLGSSCKVCNILWLKFLDCCLKQYPFYRIKTALFTVTRFLVNVSLIDNEQLLTQALPSMGGVDTRHNALPCWTVYKKVRAEIWQYGTVR